MLPRLKIILKMYAFTFVFFYLFLKLFYTAVGLSKDIFGIALGSSLMFFSFALPFMVIWMRIYMWFVNGDDPAYQNFRLHGGDPFLDHLPGPFSLAANSKEFVPPLDWEYQCPRCAARMPVSFGVCYKCNYGADGDTTDYISLYGLDRPDDYVGPSNAGPYGPNACGPHGCQDDESD